MTTTKPNDPVASVALLGDPNRRRLYELVAASPDAVGRDDAAAALGISRELAAFHLDRLVAGGLLGTEYRRRSGRTGPGAGRPAKLYRRAPVDVEVTLPSRRYERAASYFASALDALRGGPARDAVAETAREEGRRLGAQARHEAGARPGERRSPDRPARCADRCRLRARGRRRDRRHPPSELPVSLAQRVAP